MPQVQTLKEAEIELWETTGEYEAVESGLGLRFNLKNGSSSRLNSLNR